MNMFEVVRELLSIFGKDKRNFIEGFINRQFEYKENDNYELETKDHEILLMLNLTMNRYWQLFNEPEGTEISSPNFDHFDAKFFGRISWKPDFDYKLETMFSNMFATKRDKKEKNVFNFGIRLKNNDKNAYISLQEVLTVSCLKGICLSAIKMGDKSVYDDLIFKNFLRHFLLNKTNKFFLIEDDERTTSKEDLKFFYYYKNKDLFERFDTENLSKLESKDSSVFSIKRKNDWTYGNKFAQEINVKDSEVFEKFCDDIKAMKNPILVVPVLDVSESLPQTNRDKLTLGRFFSVLKDTIYRNTQTEDYNNKFKNNLLEEFNSSETRTRLLLKFPYHSLSEFVSIYPYYFSGTILESHIDLSKHPTIIPYPFYSVKKGENKIEYIFNDVGDIITEQTPESLLWNKYILFVSMESSKVHNKVLETSKEIISIYKSRESINEDNEQETVGKIIKLIESYKRCALSMLKLALIADQGYLKDNENLIRNILMFCSIIEKINNGCSFNSSFNKLFLGLKIILKISEKMIEMNRKHPSQNIPKDLFSFFFPTSNLNNAKDEKPETSCDLSLFIYSSQEETSYFIAWLYILSKKYIGEIVTSLRNYVSNLVNGQQQTFMKSLMKLQFDSQENVYLKGSKYKLNVSFKDYGGFSNFLSLFFPSNGYYKNN